MENATQPTPELYTAPQAENTSQSKSIKRFIVPIILILIIAALSAVAFLLYQENRKLAKENQDITNDLEEQSDEIENDENNDLDEVSSDDDKDENEDISDTSLSQDDPSYTDSIETLSDYYVMFDITNLQLNTNAVIQLAIQDYTGTTLEEQAEVVYDPDDAIVNSEGTAYLEFEINSVSYNTKNLPLKLVLFELTPDSMGNVAKTKLGEQTLLFD
jgi:cytoskeletal protein RodZ